MKTVSITTIVTRATIALVVMIGISESKAQVPHLVYGTAINNLMQPSPELAVTSWLTGYEELVIEALFSEGEFEIEVADFNLPWEPGDELVMAFHDLNTAQLDTISLVLNEDPWQCLDWLHLQSIEIGFDNALYAEMEVGEIEQLTIRVRYQNGVWSAPCNDYCSVEIENTEVLQLLPVCRLEAAAPGESEVSVRTWGTAAVLERRVIAESVRQGMLPVRPLFSCATPITSSHLQLDARQVPLELTLYNLLGRELWHSTVTTAGVNLSGVLPGSGSYILVGRRGEQIQRQLLQVVW